MWVQVPPGLLICRDGGTGRHDRFKTCCLMAWGFDSPFRHIIMKEKIIERFEKLPEINRENFSDFFLFFNLSEGDIFRVPLLVKYHDVINKANSHGIILCSKGGLEEYNHRIDFMVNHGKTYGPLTVFIKGFLQ